MTDRENSLNNDESLSAVEQLYIDDFNLDFDVQDQSNENIDQLYIDNFNLDHMVIQPASVESAVEWGVREHLDALVDENVISPTHQVYIDNFNLEYLVTQPATVESDIEWEVRDRLDALVAENASRPLQCDPDIDMLLYGGGAAGGSRQYPEVYNYQASGSDAQQPTRSTAVMRARPNSQQDAEDERLMNGFEKIEIVENSRSDQHYRQCYRKSSLRFRFKNVESVADFDEAVEEISRYIRTGELTKNQLEFFFIDAL